MKKTIAMILALIMCLSVGMMAFAEAPQASVSETLDETYDENANDTDENEIKTNVDILVTTNNINVTVPLDVAIVADIGGGDCDVPTNYKIINNSYIDVEVQKVEISNTHANWKIAAAAITAGTKPTSEKNDLYMTINGVSLAEATGDLATPWGIDAATTAAAGELVLPLVASTSMLNTTTLTDNAVTVMYTIAVA